MAGYVYIMTNKQNGTLYVGVTSNLPKRVWEHKSAISDSFTKRYKLTTLVYYEVFEDIQTAIEYEKKFKNRNREFKLRLIELKNPDWKDLFEEICA
jgi:putative endonuclease